MAREKFSLVPEEVKNVQQFKSMIQSGEINPDNYKDLSPEQQNEVNQLLFEMAVEQINLAQGVSAVEFILFAYIRIMNKKVSGLALSAEERKIEEKLNRILDIHQITNVDVSMDDWLFDYLKYAENAAIKILENREDHIERKKK